MTPRPTFSETVSKLVKAYFNDELEHGNCATCVVGNLCGGDKRWIALFYTDCKKNIQYRALIDDVTNAGNYYKISYDEAIQVISITGYSARELARIEYAFETSDKGKTEDDWMFNGLMDVVDVLADIHGIDLREKEEAKAMFQKC